MGRDLRPIFTFHSNFIVMKKQKKRYKKNDDSISPHKSYSDGNIIKRIYKWLGKVVSQHLKFSNVKRSWVILTPIWATISLLIFGIQYSVTSILRINHGKLYSGLIVIFCTSFFMVLINRPFTFEELSLLASESWNFFQGVFTKEEIEFRSFLSALIRPQSIGLLVITALFVLSASVQVTASFFGKWTNENPYHSGNDLIYLALQKYAPISNRYMVTVFQPALLSLAGMGFLYFGDVLASIWLFLAAIIIALYETAKNIEQNTLPM